MSPAPPAAWIGRARAASASFAGSIRLRMVAVFVLLALATTAVFLGAAQRVFSLGWREAARPILADYVDRLAREVAGDGPGPPSVERAAALAARLPLTVSIAGPAVNWSSHPASYRGAGGDDRDGPAHFGDRPGARWRGAFSRTTADGHLIAFGLDERVLEHRRAPGFAAALLALLVPALLAWLYVRRLLAPLEAIGAGARRFGAGDFDRPIALAPKRRPDELSRLAATVDAMGRDIHGMLEGKRALLLAISHELRSPLTRARVHAELLPEGGDAGASREALMRDLGEIAALIDDLLESERLAGRHAALHREPTDLAALARDVLDELHRRHPDARPITLEAAGVAPSVDVDPARVRLLLRNLGDNALRHAAAAERGPAMAISADASTGAVTIELRDFGPGVAPQQLARLAEPFHRPDDARSRAGGGVGLGLHLARLVAEAHGGGLTVENASPGLRVIATFQLLESTLRHEAELFSRCR